MDKQAQGMALYNHNRQRGFPYQKLGAHKTNQIRSLKSSARLVIEMILKNETSVLDLLADLEVPFAVVAANIDNPRDLLLRYFEFVISVNVDKDAFQIKLALKDPDIYCCSGGQDTA